MSVGRNGETGNLIIGSDKINQSESRHDQPIVTVPGSVASCIGLRDRKHLGSLVAFAVVVERPTCRISYEGLVLPALEGNLCVEGILKGTSAVLPYTLQHFRFLTDPPM